MRSFLVSRHSRFIMTGFVSISTPPIRCDSRWQYIYHLWIRSDPIQTCIIISHTLFKTLTAVHRSHFFIPTPKKDWKLSVKLDKNWIILFFPWHSEDRLIKIQFCVFFFSYFICKQRPTKVLHFFLELMGFAEGGLWGYGVWGSMEPCFIHLGRCHTQNKTQTINNETENTNKSAKANINMFFDRRWHYTARNSEWIKGVFKEMPSI